MQAQLTGQYFPGTSLLHRLDARAKLYNFILLTAAIILSNTLFGYIFTIVCMGILIKLSEFPPSIAFGSIQRLSKLFVFVFILNALFYSSENPIFQFWIFTLSIEGIIQGLTIIFRVVLVMILSNLLTLSTKPMEITSALSSLIKPLKYIGIPVEEVSMILSIAIQFIPTLLEETDTIKKAQIARGARFESKKLRERAMAMIPLVVPIFLSAFKRADELAMAMEARGYRGAKMRTQKKTPPLAQSDWGSILFCLCLCIFQVIC